LENQKNTNKKKITIYAVIMVVMLLIAIGSGVVIILDRNQPERAAEEYQTLAAEVHTGAVSVDFQLLSEKNADVRAWIISEGTGIDYPIVQNEDSEYYRDHLFSGSGNRFGCLYIDAAQSADFSGRNTVIHGGALLDPIYKYAQQDYYELIPSMTLSTPEASHTVLLYAGVRTDDIATAIRTEFADNTEFADYISWLAENSVFDSSVTVAAGDRIVTLCASDGTEGFVLVGKLA